MTGGASGIFPCSGKNLSACALPSDVLYELRSRFCMDVRVCRAQTALQQAFPFPCRRTGTRFDSRPQRPDATSAGIQRIHHEAVPAECERIYAQVWEEAKDMEDLILGVDDFAIKKGHTL